MTTIDVPEIYLEDFSTYSTRDIMDICKFNPIEDLEVDVDICENYHAYDKTKIIQ